MAILEMKAFIGGGKCCETRNMKPVVSCKSSGLHVCFAYRSLEGESPLDAAESWSSLQKRHDRDSVTRARVKLYRT